MPESIRNCTIVPVALLAMLTTATGLAGELPRGALLAASCEGCHGPRGHSPGAIPDISSQSAEALRNTLQEFRTGERPSTVMARHVKGYTLEEVAQIAEYFGTAD